jgi:PGF-CTERM protein
MRRETALAGGAAGVVVFALLVAAAVPGVLADPSADEPVRPGRLALNDLSVASGPVGGQTATLTVTTRLEHDGPPTEDVAVVVRAYDAESGLLETSERVAVGTVTGDREVSVAANLTVPREGGYRIESVVYRNGSRQVVGERRLSGLDALTPDYARTGVGFVDADVPPPLSVSVTDADAGGDGDGADADVGDGDRPEANGTDDRRRVSLSVGAALVNRGDDRSDPVTVEVVARQADSNLVADRARVEAGTIRPGRTAETTAALTVADGYNYYVDAVVYRDGVLIDTARTVANLDPTERISVNETVRGTELDVSDFERRVEGTRTPMTTDAATSGGTPGFGPVVTLAAVGALAALATVRRWSR